MIYTIKPVDDYFFRSPVPFEAGGETTVLHSIFPPLPSTFAGAFRKLVIDRQNSSSSLKIGWNGLMTDGKISFPMPRDLYRTKQKKDLTWLVKPKGLINKKLSNFPLDYRMNLNEKSDKKEKIQVIPYMQEDMMQAYLNADAGELTCVDLSAGLIRSRRLGIAIDKRSGVSKNQNLYTIEGIRPQENINLAVEVQGDLISFQGVLKIGGEAKLGDYNRTDRQINVEPPTGASRYFKLYLATPAIFRNGWLPGWIDEHTQVGYFKSRKKAVKLKLISACVERSVLCGGFGSVKTEEGKIENLPVEMRYAVPAGSVYYFKLLEGTYEDAVKLFHQKCISDYRERMGFQYQVFNRSRYCDRGFGYSLVGRLNKEQEGLLDDE